MSADYIAEVIKEMKVQVDNGYHVSEEDYQKYVAAVAIVNSTLKQLEKSR